LALADWAEDGSAPQLADDLFWPAEQSG